MRCAVTLTAYAVVCGTLVVQGITLGPLIRRLGRGGDGAVEAEVARVRGTLAERIIAALAHREGEAAASIQFRLRGIGVVDKAHSTA